MSVRRLAGGTGGGGGDVRRLEGETGGGGGGDAVRGECHRPDRPLSQPLLLPRGSQHRPRGETVNTLRNFQLNEDLIILFVLIL